MILLVLEKSKSSVNCNKSSDRLGSKSFGYVFYRRVQRGFAILSLVDQYLTLTLFSFSLSRFDKATSRSIIITKNDVFSNLLFRFY